MSVIFYADISEKLISSFWIDISRTRSLPLCPLVFSLIWKVVIIHGFMRTAYSEQNSKRVLFFFFFFFLINFIGNSTELQK